MFVRRSGYVLIVLGFLITFLSIGADLFGIGKPGIQAAQLLGAQVGFLVLMCGAALIVAQRSGSFQSFSLFKGLKNVLDEQPLIIWIVAGFLVAYFMFFIVPMFLDPRLQFQYFNRYLPDNLNLGEDIRQNTKYTSQWLIEGKSPYLDNFMFFPPFINIFQAPLVLVGFPTSYYLILGLEILSNIGLAVFLPVLISKKRDLSIVFFFFLTGLFSYGMQFELERGQFNLITIFICLLAIYIYHCHEEFRLFAYILFSIAVQLKLYPLIFIVMFIKDWRDWKNNLLRMAGILALNFGLLFILGYSMFLDFFRSLTIQIGQTGAYGWVGNNSIKAFVFNLGTSGLGLLSGNSLDLVRQNDGIIQILLLALVGVCLISILVGAYRQNENGLNPYLLMACTMGAMVIPAVSNDYKLSILAAPMSVLFCKLALPENNIRRNLSLLLVFLISFFYSITLFPFKYRPDFLANSFPLLLMILISTTLIYHLKDGAETK